MEPKEREAMIDRWHSNKCDQHICTQANIDATRRRTDFLQGIELARVMIKTGEPTGPASDCKDTVKERSIKLMSHAHQLCSGYLTRQAVVPMLKAFQKSAL